MSIVIRYIFRNLVVVFLCGFIILTLVLLVGGLVNEAIDRHLPFIVVVRLVPFFLAKMLTFSLPITLLLAVTTFFSRMSGNNEVIALKALGIPPKVFLLPVFAVAILISVIGVGINELSVTWGQQGINRVIYRSAESIMMGQLKGAHHFTTDNNDTTILVKGIDEQRRLIKPTIILKKEAITIEAEIAQVTIDFSKELLTITLTDFRVMGEGGKFMAAGTVRIFSISLTNFVPSEESNSPSNMGLFRIGTEQQKAMDEIELQRRVIAAHRVFGVSMGSVDDWATPAINGARERIRSLQSYYDRLSVEPPRRWATGFCCFFFVWFGAPLAIWMRRTDGVSSFFACFIPILILYYPLLMFGLSQAKDGTLPPVCVWLANVTIGIVGYWFWRQIHRY